MTAKAGLTGVLLLSATAGWADRLTLRSGTVHEGNYLGGTARQIRMEINGDVETFDINDVRSLNFSESGGANQPNGRLQPAPGNQSNYPQAPGPQASNYPPPRSQSSEGTNYPSSRSQSSEATSYPSSRSQSSAPVAGTTIPADTPIQIRMIDSVNSETARLGQTFQASLDEPIYVNGQQVVPRGADVLTKIVDDKDAGKLNGRNVLTLALSQISINGRFVDVTSSDVRNEAGSQSARTAKVVGGTAALGAIVGAIAGGGKGAAIGAGSGAALGGAATVLTKGPQVKIPSETRLTFRLQAPVSW